MKMLKWLFRTTEEEAEPSWPPKIALPVFPAIVGHLKKKHNCPFNMQIECVGGNSVVVMNNDTGDSVRFSKGEFEGKKLSEWPDVIRTKLENGLIVSHQIHYLRFPEKYSGATGY